MTKRTLRVDHERPATRVADDDAIVDAEAVDRKSGDRPGADLYRVAKRSVQ